MQEIRHTLFGQLLFPLAFLPYSTCCQELCSAVLYSFCKVLRKSKHPCCRLRLTRLVLTVSAVSFLLHPTVLSAEVRLVWLVKARCEETAEGGEKMEKVMKEEREGEGEIYSACQFVVLSDTRPTAFWWFVPCFTFLLRGCCSFLVWEAGASVHSCVCLWDSLDKLWTLSETTCDILWHVHHVVFQCTVSHKVSKMEGSLIVYQ